jgi:tRNA wybutosine-synthesizing protein 3
MNFQKEKKEFLTKKDKSRKGSIDIKIKKLVDKINSLEDFYTTSSCSGRILIFVKPKSNRKNEVKYLFNCHNKTNYNEIKKVKLNGDVWFKVEGAILHVASKNIDSTKKFLNAARDIGFKRSGIISIGKSKIIMELVSTEKIETIIAKNKKLLVDESYLKILIKEGNEKLERTWKKIDKLYNSLK